VVGREEAALYPDRNHCGCRRYGSQDEVHDGCLHEYGIEGLYARENEPRHRAGEYDQTDRFGRFDLGNQRSA